MAEPSAERDRALLLDIVLSARDALSFVDGLDASAFAASRLHQNAVIRSLEVIGEAAGKVSPEMRAMLNEVPWNDITGMRHRLVHDYANVNVSLVWETVRDRLRPLIERLEPWVVDEGEPR